MSVDDEANGMGSEVDPGDGDVGFDGDDEMVTCTKCDEQVRKKDSHSSGRSGRTCKLCFNSFRALSNYYRKRGKKEEFDRMEPSKKKRLIVENKNGGGIRGKERNIKMLEQASRGIELC